MGKLTKVFTVALVGAMFLIISISFFAELDSNYHSNKSSQFQEVYESLNRSAFITMSDTQQKSEAMGSNFSGISTTTADQPTESIWASSLEILRILLGLPNLAANVLRATSSYLGLPSWFIGMVVMIVVVTVVSIGLAILLNRKP